MLGESEDWLQKLRRHAARHRGAHKIGSVLTSVVGLVFICFGVLSVSL
jgi:hypothetical protein